MKSTGKKLVRNGGLQGRRQFFPQFKQPGADMDTPSFFQPAPATTNKKTETPKSEPKKLPQFEEQFMFSDENTPNFDAIYEVKGPKPSTGTLWITHKVFINYPWNMVNDKAAREEFEKDLSKSIHDGWSNKRLLRLKDPAFSEYQCNVDVNVAIVKKPADAHTIINLHKLPKDSKRFRSNVREVPKTSAETTHIAELETRDVKEEEEHHNLNFVERVWQIHSFGYDRSDIDSLDGNGKTILSEYQEAIKPHISEDDTKENLLDEPAGMMLIGRASNQGDKEYNKKLGQKRADSVSEKIKQDAGKPDKFVQAESVGEEHATSAEKFRRVDAYLIREDKAVSQKQNTAAHEFGHMIGFGDEYVEESGDGVTSLPKFAGDKPTHYDDVERILGKEAADELLIRGSSSIMSSGADVKRGHYVYFVDIMNKMTGRESLDLSRRWNVD
jgi:outer membrane protein OmpA-like peptidoglycan-associated protein